ncbi:hypothetical protein FVE85_2728 [Porphyridium purpureum]|uniref:Uncharacterized protein n=1 Tax=Porphyridium purpureum TaxID=35688 RepID=A0A5J4YVQ4_PORPP|nr:hypothetical protein FVE85_2728 [Porphyridium purpureum]|eukprot:POR3709..scf227_4
MAEHGTCQSHSENESQNQNLNLMGLEGEALFHFKQAITHLDMVRGAVGSTPEGLLTLSWTPNLGFTKLVYQARLCAQTARNSARRNSAQPVSAPHGDVSWLADVVIPVDPLDAELSVLPREQLPLFTECQDTRQSLKNADVSRLVNMTPVFIADETVRELSSRLLRRSNVKYAMDYKARNNRYNGIHGIGQPMEERLRRALFYTALSALGVRSSKRTALSNMFPHAMKNKYALFAGEADPVEERAPKVLMFAPRMFRGAMTRMFCYGLQHPETRPLFRMALRAVEKELQDLKAGPGAKDAKEESEGKESVLDLEEDDEDVHAEKDPTITANASNGGAAATVPPQTYVDVREQDPLPVSKKRNHASNSFEPVKKARD